MIRYRKLNESENTDIHLYDVVRCAGYEWYVIDIKKDIVTLLAKSDNFGVDRFDDEFGEYKTSDIRKYLRYKILPKLQRANPIPTKLRDVGVTDRVWLLSTDEAKYLPRDIRGFPSSWWLRSHGCHGHDATIVLYDGDVNIYGYFVYDNYFAIRPAMRVRVEDLD